MKDKIIIIFLFAFQALAIPFALLSGFLLLISIEGLSETDLTQTKVVIQCVVALITLLIGVLYIGTYIFSLIKTIINKKVSFISCLPVFHGIIFVYAVMLWGCVNQWWIPGDNSVIASLPRYKNSDCYYGENIQGNTGYCKYYFSNDDAIVEKVEENKYFKQVTVEDIEKLKGYFDNFKGMVEYEEYIDEYDFKYECIDTLDYIYIEMKDTYGKYQNYPDKYSEYNVYLFDVQTKTLYYIISNIKL